MNNSNRSIFRAALAVAVFASAGPVLAAPSTGTLAGTNISNTATVQYTVGTVPQTPADSNTVQFKVDRKIVFNVASLGDVTVVPGASGQVLAYTVHNGSNDTLDFRLVYSQLNSDDFDATGMIIRVESGGVAGYDPTDTLNYIDELGPDQTATVYIVSAIPLSAADGDSDNLTLTAVAAQNVDVNGQYDDSPAVLAADAIATPGGDTPGFVDTVFADVLHGSDVARNGADSDNGDYNVISAKVQMTKSSTVITDPINCATAGLASSCTSAPKAIPGAVIEYCFDVNNVGNVTATALSIQDALQAETTFVSSTIRTGASDADAAMDSVDCLSGSGTAEDDDASGADDGPAQAGGSIAGSTVTITLPSVLAGSRAKALFRVTVN